MATTQSVISVQQLYVAYYGRPGDPSGVAYWTDYFATTNDVDLALAAFGESAEFTDIYGGLSPADLVDSLFQQMFNRDADAEGQAFYTELLASGEATLASIALDISNGALPADQAVLNNKISVANAYTAEVESAGGEYGARDMEEAKALLAAVDDTDESVTAGTDAVAESVAANEGSTPAPEAEPEAEPEPEPASAPSSSPAPAPAPEDTSVVVFNLTAGASSDHSSREFDEDIAYTIYLKVDSEGSAVTMPASEQWSQAENLGVDDLIVLVGSGEPVVGTNGGVVSKVGSETNEWNWQTSAGSAAYLSDDGYVVRSWSGTYSVAHLWSGEWESNPNSGATLGQVYLTTLPGSIDLPEDESAPTLESSSPADDSYIGLDDNLTLTFDSEVALGTGNIVITDGTDVHTIDVANHDGQLSIDGNTLTINPDSDLANLATYHVEVASGAITDLAGNTYAGIADSTTLNFDAVDDVVVFDLTTGLSSDHSSQTFSDGIAYTIYLKVDSDSSSLDMQEDEQWGGAENLGADDLFVLVGSGSAVVGPKGGEVDRFTSSIDTTTLTIGWKGDDGSWAFYGAHTGWFDRITENNGHDSAIIFASGSWAPLANSGATIDDVHLTALPGSVTLPFSSPTITAFTSTTEDGAYKAGDVISITATTSKAVQAGNSFTVTLNTGDDVVLTAAGAGTSLVGSYIIGAGDTSSALTVSSYVVGTVVDDGGHPMITTDLPATNVDTDNALEVDTTAPTLDSSSPADDGFIGLDDNLTLTFDSEVALGTGNIVITDGTDVHTIDVANHGDQLSIDGKTLTINPTADLANIATYHVEVASGAITDLAGNTYAGIAESTILNFDAVDDVVVFDLTQGLSSDHSSQTFNAGVAYTIYIKVDSASAAISLGDDEVWDGGDNLDADDLVVFVGTGAPIGAFGNGIVTKALITDNRHQLISSSGSLAISLQKYGDFWRGVSEASSSIEDLFNGTWGALRTDVTLNQVYLTAMPVSAPLLG